MALCRLIAKCRCGQAYYDTPRGWAGMLSHIDIRDHVGNHVHIHQWVEVTDLVVMRNDRGERETKLGWT